MVLSISSNVNNLATINNRPVSQNDIYLDAYGNISMSSDLQCVLENCAQAAKTLLGEMVLDVNQGIPYQEVVWIGVPNIQQFSAALRTAFLNVTGVVEVVSLIIGQTNSILTYTAVIRTIFGAGAING